MSSTDSGYMQYLAYLQAQATQATQTAQTGAIHMLQREMIDAEKCNQFGNLKDTIVRDTHALGEQLNRTQLFDAKEFCDLGNKVNDNERNVINNINRTSSDTQGLISKDGIATRLSITDSTSTMKDQANTNAQWIRSDISSGNANLKDTLNTNTQWVRDDVVAGNANLKDVINMIGIDSKDQLNSNARWLHENIINGNSNLKDASNYQSTSLKDSVNQQAASLKDSVNQQVSNLKDAVNAQAINVKDTVQLIGQTNSSATERVNVNVLESAAQTQAHISEAQHSISAQGQMAAFEARLAAKDMAATVGDKTSEIKDKLADKFGYGLNNINENLSWSKYEALKNKEALAFQMSQGYHGVNEKLSRFEHSVDKQLCGVERNINSNIDGNFRFTNEKLSDSKYEALKNKESISHQLTNNQHLTTFELNKQATDLSKQMMCGFSSVTQQLNDAKYEALKNKEKLYAQAAANFATNQMEAYKNKCDLAMQIAEVKFDASKNKDHLSRQIEECCCELKMEVSKDSCDIQQKIDQKACEQKELSRSLDETRVRDALRDSATENAFLKLAAYTGIGDDYCYGYGNRKRHGYVNENKNHIYVDVDDKHRRRDRDRDIDRYKDRYRDRDDDSSHSRSSRGSRGGRHSDSE